jgi:hypothetical protein
MPYYVGAGEPEWDEYLTLAEDQTEPLTSLFKYVEPWIARATVLQFPETPGPQPKAPSAKPAPQPLSPQQLLSEFEEKQRHAAESALWKLSSMTAKCRAAGIKRVFGGYDGGGDESFTHCRSIEMNDGRLVSAATSGAKVNGIDCERLIEHAAFALMGSFDAGEFVLRGALVIDFNACTITDERDADEVFGEASDD